MDKPEVFVLAAGEASRFSSIPKQLLMAGSSTLLGRIEEQVHEETGRYPLVMTHNSAIKIAARRYAEPTEYATTCNTFLSTSPYWGQRNVVLLGDVWYTDAAMKRILRFDGDVGVFGNTWEIFAWSFSMAEAERVVSALLMGATCNGGVPGKLRYAYKALAGLAWNSEERENVPPDPVYFQYTNDGTMDVDSETEYKDLQRKVANG